MAKHPAALAIALGRGFAELHRLAAICSREGHLGVGFDDTALTTRRDERVRFSDFGKQEVGLLGRAGDGKFRGEGAGVVVTGGVD